MLFAKDQDMIQAIAPEASLPLRGHRPAFFERVSQLLKDADVLIPARVLEACRQAQGEFLIGGPNRADETQPTPTSLRSPYQAR